MGREGVADNGGRLDGISAFAALANTPRRSENTRDNSELIFVNELARRVHTRVYAR
jgi:hypothetical protein